MVDTTVMDTPTRWWSTVDPFLLEEVELVLANSSNESGSPEDGKFGGGGGGTPNTHTSGDGGAGIVVVEEFK